MSASHGLQNRLRDFRLKHGWSQDELAVRAGISRPGVSAIEMNRLVPSAAAALSLAKALGCRVEDLFSLPGAPHAAADWAWPPERSPSRYWRAEVADRILRYPVEANGLGFLEHDGVCRKGSLVENGRTNPRDTLVMACCDPAAGVLVAEMAKSKGIRVLVLTRSSQQALTLLSRNLVHIAGVHLVRATEPSGNAALVRARLGGGYSCLHLAHWQEGVALGCGVAVRSIREALQRDLRWVGRETGSGARQCLDELLEKRRAPRRIAHDHRSVAEAVRCGWADAGVCLRLASEEAGLQFLSVREEAYDLFFPTSSDQDPRLKALVEAVRSRDYRAILGDLPGYGSSTTGEMELIR